MLPSKENRKYGDKITVKELKIGDVVSFSLNKSAFGAMTTIEKTEEKTKLFRCYTSLGDFTHTGGVTPYIGTEIIEIFNDSLLLLVWLDNIYYGKE